MNREKHQEEHNKMYENPEHDRSDLRAWMKFFTPEPGASILDLGCGAGSSLINFSERGHRIVGVEVSTKALEIYHKNKPAHCQSTAYQGFIEDFDIEDTFDYVLLTEVLEHVSDPQAVIDVAFKHLKDGGELYISAPNIPDSNHLHLRAVTGTLLHGWLHQFEIAWEHNYPNRIYCKAKRTDKRPIIVSRPFLTPYPPHMEGFQEWYARNCQKHNLKVLTQYYRALHHAQQAAVHYAAKVGATHILFTECDHWQYPDNGLDVLLEADKDVIGFQTYKRGYPHQNLCMRKENPDISMILPAKELIAKEAKLEPVGWSQGEDLIQKVDLITWAFTLVKVDVFKRMAEAWGNLLVSQEDLAALIDGDAATKYRLSEYTEEPLGLQPFRQWGPRPTDSFFCQYCADLGIDVHVHFGWTMAHGDVEPKDITMARRIQDGRNLEQNLDMLETMPIGDDWGNAYGPDVPLRPIRQVVTKSEAIAGGPNGKANSEESNGKNGSAGEETRTDKKGSRPQAEVLPA